MAFWQKETPPKGWYASQNPSIFYSPDGTEYWQNGERHQLAPLSHSEDPRTIEQIFVDILQEAENAKQAEVRPIEFGNQFAIDMSRAVEESVRGYAPLFVRCKHPSLSPLYLQEVIKKIPDIHLAIITAHPENWPSYTKAGDRNAIVYPSYSSYVEGKIIELANLAYTSVREVPTYVFVEDLAQVTHQVNTSDQTTLFGLMSDGPRNNVFCIATYNNSPEDLAAVEPWAKAFGSNVNKKDDHNYILG